MQKLSACRKRFSEIQRRFSTSSWCMIAICPVGPPKLMKPSLSQKRNASRSETGFASMSARGGMAPGALQPGQGRLDRFVLAGARSVVAGQARDPRQELLAAHQLQHLLARASLQRAAGGGEEVALRREVHEIKPQPRGSRPQSESGVGSPGSDLLRDANIRVGGVASRLRRAAGEAHAGPGEVVDAADAGAR